MSKKSFVKKPASPFKNFNYLRQLELKPLISLTSFEIRDLIKEEWQLMNEEEKFPFVEISKTQKDYFDSIKDQVLEIDVDSFMDSIKEARKKKEIDDQFKEDEVLSIVNHRQKWKSTWTKKKKEEMRYIRKNNISQGQIKKISKLKLN